MLPGCTHTGTSNLLAQSGDSAEVYPPLRTGMRGSHPGSFEVGHQLGRQGRTDWGQVRDEDSDVYDLVVVGAGLSGLSAAHFYRKENPNARILILDNHDDFGGHAKRNEFELDGRTFLSHGGSQTLQEPGSYSEVIHGLLKDIGVDIQRLAEAFDQDFYRRNGLTDAFFFDRKTYGVDRIVRYPVVDYSNFLPLAECPLTAKEAVAQMPLGENAKGEMLRLLEFSEDQLPEIPASEQEDYLWDLRYLDFLKKHLGASDPQVIDLFQGLTADAGRSLEKASALSMMTYMGLPGLKATAISDYKALEEPYIHHFPDGNASVTRLLVRSLIPRVAPGTSMEDVVLAPFDYARLDEASSKVRVRLESTVVRVKHDGPVESAKQVDITYVRGGQAYQVRGRSCVLAGYNSMIRFLCPELPTSQRQALARSVKTPILYTNVLLKDWRAWKKLGIGAASSPGGYYSTAFLDFPVSMGGYQYAQNPDEPIVVHMERFPKGHDRQASMEDQLRAGRHEMFATSFEHIERETRTQLSGMLSGGGFDAARDIKAITVNRWGHGYSRSYGSSDSGNERPHIVGRKPFGRITIANADAGGSASVDAAIDEAYRAVSELNS
jgi:spermidine dehydrogenase